MSLYHCVTPAQATHTLPRQGMPLLCSLLCASEKKGTWTNFTSKTPHKLLALVSAPMVNLNLGKSIKQEGTIAASNRTPKAATRHRGSSHPPRLTILPTSTLGARAQAPQVPGFRFRPPRGPRVMAAAERLSRGGVEEAVEEEHPGALEPGAAPFGNFPHYSRFHPPEQRLRLLPPELLRQLFPPEGPERRPILGLDVGCNSGVSDAGGIGAPGAPRWSASAASVELAWAWHQNSKPTVGF